jgi:pimeloyl-ACP methyl ester carboxylesterase
MAAVDVDAWKLPSRFSYGGDEIAYAALGSEGSAIVLLHGFPGNSFTWREVAPALAQSHRVYVVDMLGFGQSAKGPHQDVSQGAQARLLATLLDEWQLESPNIVAHDIGASYALGAVLFEALAVRRLVLIDAAALNPCISSNSMHVRRFLEAYQTLPANLHATILRAHIPTTVFNPMSDETFEGYFRPWSNSVGQAAYYHFLSQLDESYFGRIEAALRELEVPTRIVWGTEDTWIPLSHAERLSELILDSEIVAIPGAGHFVADDAPQALTSAIMEFIA